MSNHKVHVISSWTIKTESTAEINLTPWDLELLFLEYSQKGLFFLNPTPQHDATAFIHNLKASLRRTLHFFPPLVGRLTATLSDDGAATSFSIDCSSGGALFIHAVLQDTDLKSMAQILDSSTLVPEYVRSFFPMTGVRNFNGVSQPLFAVQVTEVLDGLFIGCSINHLLADGTSFWHFFNSWAEISRGKIRVSKLSFINGDNVNHDFIGCNRITISTEHLICDNMPAVTQPLRDKVFYLTKVGVTKLKARANQEMATQSKGQISSLQAVIAHLWRSIIRCRFDMNSGTSEKTTFEIPMGARQRLDPPLPEEYFGNAVFPGVVTLEVDKMLQNGLGWTAWQINRMVASGNGPDKVREFYMEWIKNPNFLKFEGLPSNYFILINSPRFNVYGNDFGWGKPVAARSGGANSSDGRITISGGKEEGSMEIEVCLLTETLFKLGEDAEFMEFFVVN